MRIMCLNGWGGKMQDELLPYLAAEAPDVLCLQEVVHTPGAAKEWLDYRDGAVELPQRARFFEEVCGALPGHAAVFCPAAQGVLWEGEQSVPSQWGLATFVRKGLPVIGQAQGFVHKGYEPDGYGEHPRSRSAHVVRVWDARAERAVTIGHMHGLRDLAGKEDTAERVVQAERLRDLVAGVAEPGDGIVVCGDFNVLPDSATFEILGALGLADLVVGRGFESTRNSQYRKPGRMADYMLVNEVLSGAEFDVVLEPEVSDHCPLVLRI